MLDSNSPCRIGLRRGFLEPTRQASLPSLVASPRARKEGHPGEQEHSTVNEMSCAFSFEVLNGTLPGLHLTQIQGSGFWVFFHVTPFYWNRAFRSTLEPGMGRSALDWSATGGPLPRVHPDGPSLDTTLQAPVGLI